MLERSNCESVNWHLFKDCTVPWIWLKYLLLCRKKFHVILLHNSSASEALIMCASEHYNFTVLMDDLPLRGSIKVLMIQLACRACQWCVSSSIYDYGVLCSIFMYMPHAFYSKVLVQKWRVT